MTHDLASDKNNSEGKILGQNAHKNCDIFAVQRFIKTQKAEHVVAGTGKADASWRRCHAWRQRNDAGPRHKTFGGKNNGVCRDPAVKQFVFEWILITESRITMF